jgi:hypothetical protein
VAEEAALEAVTADADAAKAANGAAAEAALALSSGGCNALEAEAGFADDMAAKAE